MTPELDACLETFRRWLHLPDPGHVLVVLAGVIANRVEGDPVWPLLVGGPGWGKTEALNAIAGQPDVYAAATLTEAALLSGTPRKDRPGGAKGGLLKQIGEFGIIALKDFGSVLSMNRDTRAQLLAALREVYDGAWTRHVGVDGGRTLHWEGKIGLIAGCTPVIDSHHAVLSSLGDRFIFYRMPAEGGHEQAARALAHIGAERAMRAELARAAQGVLEAADMELAAAPVRDDERDRLISLAELAVRCRSAVERDPYRREIDLIPEPEAPARLSLCLLRLLNALEAIGADREIGWQIVTKCALDCMPAIRRRVAQALLAEPGLSTPVLAMVTFHPTTTTRRALEDLTAHGVATRRKRPAGNLEEDFWTLTDWAVERWPTTDISGTENGSTDISGTEFSTEIARSRKVSSDMLGVYKEKLIDGTDISGTDDTRSRNVSNDTLTEKEGADIVAAMRARGLAVRLKDDRIMVSPSGRLKDHDRALLVDYRSVIVAALRTEAT